MVSDRFALPAGMTEILGIEPFTYSPRWTNETTP